MNSAFEIIRQTLREIPGFLEGLDVYKRQTKGAVRRHCHTMALYRGRPLSRSQSKVVSR